MRSWYAPAVVVLIGVMGSVPAEAQDLDAAKAKVKTFLESSDVQIQDRGLRFLLRLGTGRNVRAWAERLRDLHDDVMRGRSTELEGDVAIEKHGLPWVVHFVFSPDGASGSEGEDGGHPVINFGEGHGTRWIGLAVAGDGGRASGLHGKGGEGGSAFVRLSSADQVAIASAGDAGSSGINREGNQGGYAQADAKEHHQGLWASGGKGGDAGALLITPDEVPPPFPGGPGGGALVGLVGRGSYGVAVGSDGGKGADGASGDLIAGGIAGGFGRRDPVPGGEGGAGGTADAAFTGDANHVSYAIVNAGIGGLGGRGGDGGIFQPPGVPEPIRMSGARGGRGGDSGDATALADHRSQVGFQSYDGGPGGGGGDGCPDPGEGGDGGAGGKEILIARVLGEGDSGKKGEDGFDLCP